MPNLIKVTIQNNRGYISISRPEKRNPLSIEVINEMIDALLSLESDNSVRAIIILGEGSGFSAGGDISEMGLHNNLNESMNWMRHASQLTKTIMELNKYVVAAVHGYAAGAGFSLALACDFIVAEPQAKFICSFVNIGLVPDLGLTKLLTSRLPLPLAKELIVSGRPITGKELYRLGLINSLSESTTLRDEVEHFTQFLIDGPPLTHLFGKKIIHASLDSPYEKSIMDESIVQAFLNSSDDHKEGVSAFFEKRTPQFKGR